MGNHSGKEKSPRYGEKEAAENYKIDYIDKPQEELAEFHRIISNEKEEDLNKMRRDLERNLPMTFILNNLVLSIQFFKNLESDKETMKNLKQGRQDMQEWLAKKEGSSEHDVDLKKMTGFRGNLIPSLKYHIIYENLKIYPEHMYESLKNNNNNAADKAISHYCTEEIKDLPGWVMLRCVECQAPSQVVPCNGDVTFAERNIDTNDSEDDVIATTAIGRNDESSFNDNELIDDNDYPTSGKQLLQNIKTTMKENEGRGFSSKFNNQRRRQSYKILHQQNQANMMVRRRRSSFGVVQQPDDDHYDDAEALDAAQRRQQMEKNEPKFPESCNRQLKLVAQKNPNTDTIQPTSQNTYFSSQDFFDHFKKSFYGLVDSKNKRSHEGAICSNEGTSGGYDPIPQFFPVIRVPYWPQKADKWVTRKRNHCVDSRTKLEYVWPPVEQIIEQGCYLIAAGGQVAGRPAELHDMQWQLSFATAHEALIGSLQRQHLQCRAWALYIFRYHLAGLNIITEYHIDTVFLTLVEQNYIGWRDVSLGEKVWQIFDRLLAALKIEILPDYFIRERNLLSSKCKSDIDIARERVSRLMEKFVSIAIQTASRIQPDICPDPFPKIEELWEILTKHPDKLNKENKSPQKDQQKTDVRQPINIKDTPIIQLGDETRTLLNFFIRHFILLAEKSNASQDFASSTVLLNHAANLCQMLDERGCQRDADTFLDQIEKLRGDCNLQLDKPIVNIPGSPCIFRTEIAKPVNNSSISSVSHPMPEQSISPVNWSTSFRSSVVSADVHSSADEIFDQSESSFDGSESPQLQQQSQRQRQRQRQQQQLTREQGNEYVVHLREYNSEEFESTDL